MNHLFFIWFNFNWLEFVTYVIIPVAMLVYILLYIYFNIRLIRISLYSDIWELKEITKLSDLKLDKLISTIS
jgi:hypothetical protein